MVFHLAQAVGRRGGEVLWVELEDLKVEKECVYVLNDFSSQQYKTLVGQCR